MTIGDKNEMTLKLMGKKQFYGGGRILGVYAPIIQSGKHSEFLCIEFYNSFKLEMYHAERDCVCERETGRLTEDTEKERKRQTDIETHRARESLRV